VLRELGGAREWPMMCGIFEASSLDRRVRGLAAPRPLTHDALVATVAALGGELEDVLISDLREGIYYAKLRIRQAGRRVEVDVRPSDAMTTALVADVPIFLANAVVDEVFNAPPPGPGAGP